MNGQVDWGEAGLRFAGVVLATSSFAFAAHMNLAPSRQPDINGLEHLAIYAKPASNGARRVANAAGVDYTPVGATHATPAETSSGVEIVAAMPQAAILRTGQNLIPVRVGERLGVFGRIRLIEKRDGKWTLVTENGDIRER